METHHTFEFSPTPLLLAIDNEPTQICRLTIGNQPTTSSATLRVRRPDGDFDFSIDVPTGESTREIPLPEVDTPCNGAVELTIGEQKWTTEVAFAPVRRWTVFFVNHSHTDIGFTHTLSDVVEIHNKNLEQALAWSDATADWPSDARFRWTCESAWQVQNYLRARPQDRARLAKATHEGLIEIEALYIHSYFDLLSREQLVRTIAYAQHLREELAAPITSAMICDVPGCSWSLVDLLAAAGVRYLSMAPNNFIAPFHAMTDLPRPFVWQGPAGGRVLVWYTDDPFWAYIEGARHGFWQGLPQVEAKLPAKLAQLEADGYPFDAVQIQLGSDNRPLRLLPATIARDWNRKYLSPRIRIATPSSFFRYAEENWSDRLPVVSGEWQSSWSQTTLHYPQEASLSRRNHGTLDLWERLAVVADWVNEAYRYPATDIDDAYEASLLFDEHGGPKGIWRPRSDEEALTALHEGYQLFERETEPAREGLAAALHAASGAFATGDAPAIVLWNILSWPRGGTVEVTLPAAWLNPGALLIDETTDQPVPFETIRADGDEVRCRLRCPGVPALGFKRFRLSSSIGQISAVAPPTPTIRHERDAAVVERGRFSLDVDAGGQITRLVDATTGIDLIDRAIWPGANTLVHYVPEPHGPEMGGDFTADKRLYEGVPIDGRALTNTTVTATELRIVQAHDRTTVHTDASIDDTYRWQSAITVHDDWIEVTNQLRWLQRPTESETLYVLFPFALPNPHIRHAGQFTIVDPRAQTLSGSSLDSFAIQNWLDVSTDGRGVTVCSADLALVDYGGINLQRFLRQLSPATGCLAFRAATGRSLPPKDGDPFGRREYVELRFALRPYAGSFDPLAAHRFGEEDALPLQASALPAGHPGEWRTVSGSLVDIQSPTVILTGLKRSAARDGYVIRVWESAGRRSTARLSFPQHEILAAWRVTPAEGEMGRVDIVDGALRFELGPFESAGFRCVLGR